MTQLLPAPDLRGRALRDLRISVTDRCNFRCRYCMPRELFGADHAFLERSKLLSFSEIDEIVVAARDLGVRKLRFTGGEPLMRRGFTELVGMLSRFSDLDLAMTTNGVLLAKHARALRAAGLRRVTVSLDSLTDSTFRSMSDSKFSVEDVIAGIDAAEAAGLPVKVNMVVKRGVNDGDVVAMATRFRGTGHVVRFIEYMDVGSTNGWDLTEVVTANEITEAIGSVYPIAPLAPEYPGEVASRYRYLDGAGEIGIIPSVSAPFCGTCTRARLSAEGVLYTCLFASAGLDLRSIVRGTRSDDDLRGAIGGRWATRDDRYSEERGKQALTRPKIEMSYIGG